MTTTQAGRRGWMSSDAARGMAAERVRLAKQIEALPLLSPGERYTVEGCGLGERFTARKVSLHIGGAFVYKSTAGAKPCWYVVDANSGLAFGSFSKAVRASGLCAALGPRVCDYFARAQQGDARAKQAKSGPAGGQSEHQQDVRKPEGSGDVQGGADGSPERGERKESGRGRSGRDKSGRNGQDDAERPNSG